MTESIVQKLGSVLGEALQEVTEAQGIPNVDGPALMTALLSAKVTDDDVLAAMDEEWALTFLGACWTANVPPPEVAMAIRTALTYDIIADQVAPLFKARRECLVDDDPILAAARGVILGGYLSQQMGGSNTPLSFAAYVMLRRFVDRDA